MATKKKKGARVFSEQLGDQSERKPTDPILTPLTTLGELLVKAGALPTLPGQTGNETKWSSTVVHEQVKENTEGFDFSGKSKAWKEAYFKGLESCVKIQEEGEHFVRDTVKQGFTRSQNWLTLYKNWVEMPWEQFQGVANGVPNPFLALARQTFQAFHATADPAVKTAAGTYEATFNNYQTTLAGPFRKQVIEINKKVVEALVSA